MIRMNPDNCKAVAATIAADLAGEGPGGPVGSSFITILLQVLESLGPLLEDCLQPNETPEAAANRLTSRTLGWRVREYLLRRHVRANMDSEAPRRLVRDVTDRLWDTGQNEQVVAGLFQ